MDYLPPRTVAKIVGLTVLACSFVPGLHRLGPFLLHTTAHRLERTAHLADRLSGYSPHHPAHDPQDD